MQNMVHTVLSFETRTTSGKTRSFVEFDEI
jgi:hypothetical protein